VELFKVIFNELDRRIKLTSQHLNHLYEDQQNCFIVSETEKLRERLVLKPKNCSKKNCQICPHNMVWKRYVLKTLKDGTEKKIWGKEYPVGKVPWQLKNKLSNPSREQLQLTETKIKKILKARQKLIKAKRTLILVQNMIPDKSTLEQLVNGENSSM